MLHKSNDMRDYLIEKSIDEFKHDFLYLNDQCKKFVKGSQRTLIDQPLAASSATYSSHELTIENQQVMQDWEKPYMLDMAKCVTEGHGHVLELGFGMGISASYIQALGVKSHTIIECNSQVIEHCNQWKKKYPNNDIKIIEGRWQDVVDKLGEYDGIFFDTYPQNEEEVYNQFIRDATFASHFFKAASEHLKKGGIFTYFSDEIDSLSRRHQRELFKYFDEVTTTMCRSLQPPEDCNYWWADTLVVVKAKKTN